MDWSRTVILGLCLMAVVVFPVVMYRAIRRRDWWRVYDLLVLAAMVAITGSDALWPGAAHHRGILMRWVRIAVAALFLC